MLTGMRVPSALERLLVVGGVGVVVGVGVAFIAPWQLAVLAGWDASAALFVAWVWIGVARFTPEATRRHATQEDTNRVSASVLLLSASVVSLVGTAFALTKANNAHSGGRAMLTGFSVLTIALSWAVYTPSSRCGTRTSTTPTPSAALTSRAAKLLTTSTSPTWRSPWA